MAPGAATPRPNTHSFALLHPLNGTLTAPPVGPGRARSPTDRVAPELGGAIGRGVRNSEHIAEKLLPVAPPSGGAMAFEASAIAPVRPAELLGDDSGNAVGLNNTQYAVASVWPARLPSSMAPTGYSEQ